MIRLPSAGSREEKGVKERGSSSVNTEGVLLGCAVWK